MWYNRGLGSKNRLLAYASSGISIFYHLHHFLPPFPFSATLAKFSQKAQPLRTPALKPPQRLRVLNQAAGERGQSRFPFFSIITKFFHPQRLLPRSLGFSRNPIGRGLQRKFSKLRLALLLDPNQLVASWDSIEFVEMDILSFPKEKRKI